MEETSYLARVTMQRCFSALGYTDVFRGQMKPRDSDRGCYGLQEAPRTTTVAEEDCLLGFEYFVRFFPEEVRCTDTQAGELDSTS